MKHGLIHAQPCEAAAEAGHVVLDSECGLAVTLTPDAAAETGQRLIDAARRASDQAEGAQPPTSEAAAPGPAKSHYDRGYHGPDGVSHSLNCDTDGDLP